MFLPYRTTADVFSGDERAPKPVPLRDVWPRLLDSVGSFRQENLNEIRAYR